MGIGIQAARHCRNSSGGFPPKAKAFTVLVYLLWVCCTIPLALAGRTLPPKGYYYLQFVGQPQPTATRAPAIGYTYLTGPFTVEARMRLNGSPSGPTGVLCGQHAWGLDYDEPDGGRWWLVPVDPGDWSFFLRTDQGIVGTPPVVLPVDSWFHLAATYDGAVLRLLVNGSEVSSVPQAGTLSLWEDQYNGQTCDYWDFNMLAGISNAAGFNGNLRELALWDRALSTETLAARTSFSLTGEEEGLIHYWPLDDGEILARNLVSGGPEMILGNSPLGEGPYFNEPEWLLNEPFYAVREEWLDDLPVGLAVPLSSYAVSDFNVDGFDDFIFNGGLGAVCEAEPSPFRIMLGSESGRFEDGTDQVIVGPVPEPLVAFRSLLADFNGDDKPDFFSGNTGQDFCDDYGWTNTLLLTNLEGKLVDASANLKGRPCTADEPQYPNQAPCYRGSGYGSREPGVRYPDPALPLTTLRPDFTHSTAMGDIDDDGDIDIFVGNFPANDIETPYFLVNDGSGNFEADWDAVPQDLKHFWVAIGSSRMADMDDDGYVDLLLCCTSTTLLPGQPETPRVAGVFWGDGSGSYAEAPATPFPIPRPDFDLSTGGLLPIDFEGDGDKDLIVVYDASPSGVPDAKPTFIQALVNKGDRQFVDESDARITPPTSLGGWIFEVFELDFDANGCPDFLLSNQSFYHDEILYLNNCRGSFTAINRAVLGKMRQLIPIDANGDGDLDFISVHHIEHLPSDLAILERLRPFSLSDLDPGRVFRDGFE